MYYCIINYETQQTFWNTLINFHLTYLWRTRSGDPNLSSTDTHLVTLTYKTKVCSNLTLTECIGQTCQGSYNVFVTSLLDFVSRNVPIKWLPVTADTHSPISHESGCAFPDSGPCGWVWFLFSSKVWLVIECIWNGIFLIHTVT